MSEKIINNKTVYIIFGINILILSILIIYNAIDIHRNVHSTVGMNNLCFLLGLFTGICFYRMVEIPYKIPLKSKV